MKWPLVSRAKYEHAVETRDTAINGMESLREDLGIVNGVMDRLGVKDVEFFDGDGMGVGTYLVKIDPRRIKLNEIHLLRVEGSAFNDGEFWKIYVQ